MELVGEWVLEDASPLEENLQENEVAENWSMTNEVPIVNQTYEEMGMELLRMMEQQGHVTRSPIKMMLMIMHCS
ncbi:hypothetical protein IFM89_022280 [Coptis chinensis]|uniref:Uncharacterized protein n=1 Tax=Coptis chinensis TaxID=261450 RepID=A0A835LK74_9MAGN|nr:hypothetical protein IFM89_022280 [Coptis chinensis]